MFGKFFISAAHSIIYVLTVELYPTSIRANGMAASSGIGRIGSLVAPFISEISEQVLQTRLHSLKKIVTMFMLFCRTKN